MTQKTAIRSLDKALKLMRSVPTLEGTDKDGVEHLLEMALENLRARQIAQSVGTLRTR